MVGPAVLFISIQYFGCNPITITAFNVLVLGHTGVISVGEFTHKALVLRASSFSTFLDVSHAIVCVRLPQRCAVSKLKSEYF